MSRVSIPSLEEHYKRLAVEYDDHYHYHRDVTVKFLTHNLTFDPNDHVLDIGGGTGEIDAHIWKKARLKNPILCVDPSEEMIEKANGKEGVTPICSRAEDFFLATPKEHYDKIMFLFCIHHFKESITSIFRGVKEYLSNDGMCVIVNYINEITFRFFQALGRTWHKIDLKVICGEALEELGLKWKIITGTEHCVMKKSDWYAALRARYSSFLEPFTDAELEEGIGELEKMYGGQEEVEMDFDLQILVFTRK